MRKERDRREQQQLFIHLRGQRGEKSRGGKNSSSFFTGRGKGGGKEGKEKEGEGGKKKAKKIRVDYFLYGDDCSSLLL